jgi:hypothetical protein
MYHTIAGEIKCQRERKKNLFETIFLITYDFKKYLNTIEHTPSKFHDCNLGLAKNQTNFFVSKISPFFILKFISVIGVINTPEKSADKKRKGFVNFRFYFLAILDSCYVTTIYRLGNAGICGDTIVRLIMKSPEGYVSDRSSPNKFVTSRRFTLQ